MKTLFLAAALFSIAGLSAFGQASTDNTGPRYYGSKKSDKYHFVSCQWAKKIAPENLVVFASKKEAAAKNYKPCKVCKP